MDLFLWFRVGGFGQIVFLMREGQWHNIVGIIGWLECHKETIEGWNANAVREARTRQFSMLQTDVLLFMPQSTFITLVAIAGMLIVLVHLTKMPHFEDTQKPL